MSKKNQIDELQYFIKNSFFLDLEPQKALQMAKRLKKFKNNIKCDLPKVRIRILSNFNLEFIIDSIIFCFYQRGMFADISYSDYGTMFAELLDPKSQTFISKPDIIFIWPTYRDIQEYNVSVDKEVCFWKKLWDLPKNKKIEIVQCLFDKPPFISMNNFQSNSMNSLISHINETNLELEKKFANEISFINLETLQINVGSKNWHDNRMYALCKQPFALDAIPEISQYLTSSIASKLGKSKKVLVMDLDNTLWGGEIGDLGEDGLILGKETSDGEGYVNFQSYIKQLADMGVLLAVCSKNNEDIAKKVFINHTDMLISLEDISCFVANFKDKASNISYIKKFLNVDYDSMVFVDDSKVECEWVKRSLPDVVVINLEGDPSTFAYQLDRQGLFIKSSLTQEDKVRAKSFQAKQEIEKLKTNTNNLQSFLKSLNPVLVIEKVLPYALDRVEQLLLKTNQFKLNNTVYNKKQIEINHNNILAMRFLDKLNDYGIVVILLLDFRDKKINIINWVMSCRVFSRNIELAVLEILKKIAYNKSYKKISLEFIKSKKNITAERVIAKLGFKKNENTSAYDLNVDDIAVNSNIKVKFLERFDK